MLDDFYAVYLRSAALAWEAIEHRDDVVQSVVLKRKKAVARLNWEILTADSSKLALQQKEALENFYNNIKVVNAYDKNENGGFGLLIKQMMDAVGKKYAVHEIVYHHDVSKEKERSITATFRFVPLWFFENTTGHLRFLETDYATEGIPLDHGSWMITVGEGLMQATSIAYIFKHLPLRDWLVYCERNGMPGIKGVTDAVPGSPQWNAACDAVENFGAEFSALMSPGTNIEAIDLSTRGELPYAGIIDRMDRAIAALWRGSDLSTLSRESAVGASVQGEEAAIILEDDANLISETLNEQVDRFVINYLFGDVPVKAYLRLIANPSGYTKDSIDIYRALYDMGVPLSLEDLREKFGLSTPSNSDAVIVKDKK
jgi:phage gp29-like protein